MTIIKLDQFVAAPPVVVYDYVTRPARWKEWHPASLGTGGLPPDPLEAGAAFEEDVRSAGQLRHLRWTVKECKPALRWAADAVMDDGSRVSLLYELEPRGQGTRFTRTLEYHLKPLHLRLVNALLMWRRVQAESRLALSNLTRHFASTPRPPPERPRPGAAKDGS